MENSVGPNMGLGSWVSRWRVPQRVFTAGWLLTLCLYLVYGRYPHVVCNTIATIPAALFTYSLLVKTPSEPNTQKAILLYWSVHGVLVCFDSALSHIFGYFLAKFVLLCALFLYSVQTSASSILLRNSATNGSKSTHKLTKESCSQPSLITMRSTIASFPFFESTLSTALSESSLEAPMKTITNSRARSSTKTIYDLLKGCYKRKWKHKTTSPSESILSAATTDASTCEEHSRFEPSSFFKERGDQVRVARKDVSELAESDTDECDYLITSPSEKLIFKSPYTGCVTISLTNAHQKPMMWALKTNALQRLAAQPTCGVLPSCATVHLRIGLLESPQSNSFGVDRMAVDYCIADEGVAVFDRAVMRHKGLIRKNLSVAYIN